MSFSVSLLVHATKLYVPEYLGDETEEMRHVSQRRAISAAYYALFHHLNQAAVGLIAPNVAPDTSNRIQRWFDHAEMKKVCARFMKAKLDQPLLDLIGETASSDLQRVARTFIRLQEARHSADYDLSYRPDLEEVRLLIAETTLAMGSWDSIQGSAEANIFILSLLLWKNWDKER